MSAECEQLLQRLWAYIDGEADAEFCADLKAHLEKCPPCHQHVEFEVRLRQIIQAKCRGERAPEHLRVNLGRILGWRLALPLTVLGAWWSMLIGKSF